MASAALHASFLIVVFIAFGVAAASQRSSVLTMGINYGRIADNLPPPSEAVVLMQRMGIGNVKIFDSDPQVLSALAHTGLQVAIAVTNEELPDIAASQAAADQWVQSRVAPYYPATLINFINVGNEVLSNPVNQTLWYELVPAMQNIYSSLIKFNLKDRIKVTTSSALNTLSSSYPPSAGCFREEIAASIMQPMLQFLFQTRSYFFVNVYPYLTWAANSQQIPLQYALLETNSENSVQDGQLQYYDLLDAQLDAVASAIAKLGYPRVRLAISETGWPTNGDEGEAGANVANAMAYNQRLVKKMLAYPPIGTPLRPKTFIPTYIFALFNENLKPGPTTERNWGLLYPNGEAVYAVDLTGRGAGYAVRPRREGVTTYASKEGNGSSSGEQRRQGGVWCVANPKASPAALRAALDYACGVSASFCRAIQPHRPCFHPDTPASHASYAFHSYWLSMKPHGGTCDFSGAAILTSHNPSYGSCEYP